jgi:hypothetical protein
MPGVSTTDITAILKEVYGDRLNEQINNEVRSYKHFKQKSTEDKWEGEIYVEALHTGRNQGVKAAAERGLLPVADRQKYAELRIPDRYCYGSVEMSAQIMKEAKTKKAAFANAMEAEISGMVKDIAVQYERIIWMAGNGQLALVSVVGAGTTTLNVDTPGGVAGAINGARFLKPNMVIAIHAAGAAPSNTPNAVRTVVSLAADGTSVILDAAVSAGEAVDNGWVTLGVNRASVLEGSVNLEPMGLLGLIDDGTFVGTLFGLNRTTNPIFKAKRFNSVAALDENILHRAFDACDELSGMSPNWLTGHHSVHREYIRLTQADRRYTGENLMRPDAGISGGGKKRELTFNGLDIEKARFAPYGLLYGIDDTHLKRYINTEGEWADEDGSVMSRQSGKDVFEMYYRKFGNHGVLRCNSSFVLAGITVTVDVNNADV